MVSSQPASKQQQQQTALKRQLPSTLQVSGSSQLQARSKRRRGAGSSHVTGPEEYVKRDVDRREKVGVERDLDRHEDRGVCAPRRAQRSPTGGLGRGGRSGFGGAGAQRTTRTMSRSKTAFQWFFGWMTSLSMPSGPITVGSGPPGVVWGCPVRLMVELTRLRN